MNSSAKPPSAILASSIAPGPRGGGSQGALSYVQALSTVYNGDVVYVGPAPADGGTCLVGFPLRELVVIPKRGRLRIATDMLRMQVVDRLSGSSVMRAVVDGASPNHTVVYVYGEGAGKLAAYSTARCLCTVLHCNNFISEYIRAQTARGNLFSRLIASVTVRNALLGFRKASYRLCVTEHDRQAYLRLTGGSPSDDTSRGDMYFSYDEPWRMEKRELAESGRKMVCLSAFLGHRFNEAGILWFLQSIWPAIRREMPFLGLIVAGASPRASIADATCHAGGELHIRPSVEEMDRIHSRSLLAVAPTLEGSGIKVRVAESLRRGVPVLSTPHCARGYEDVSKQVLKLFANADQAVTGVREILRVDQRQMAKRCVEEWERGFSLTQGVRKLTEVHEWLLAHHSSPAGS